MAFDARSKHPGAGGAKSDPDDHVEDVPEGSAAGEDPFCVNSQRKKRPFEENLTNLTY